MRRFFVLILLVLISKFESIKSFYEDIHGEEYVQKFAEFQYDGNLNIDNIRKDLKRVIPTKREDAKDPELYMRAMEDFSRAADDLVDDLDDSIEEIQEDGNLERKVENIALDVLNAIEISTRELKAVNKYQKKKKKKRFLRKIADDAKDSILATVDGVENLLRTLEDVKYSKKRKLNRAINHFTRALKKLSIRMQKSQHAQGKSGRRGRFGRQTHKK